MGSEESPELSPEQIAEEIRKLKVSDLLLTNMSVIAQLGYAKLEPGSRDLEQARVAIEALRALAGVLRETVEAETLKSFEQVVANLQLAYASAAAKPDAAPETGST